MLNLMKEADKSVKRDEFQYRSLYNSLKCSYKSGRTVLITLLTHILYHLVLSPRERGTDRLFLGPTL